MSFLFDHWELEEVQPISEHSRHVRYKETCDVILIPSKEEYIECGIYLWYNKRDFKVAKNEATEEIRGLINKIPQLSFSSAMTMLYQPTDNILKSKSQQKKNSSFVESVELYFMDSSRW